MDDIEISKNSKKDNIIDVAKSIGIDKKDLILYGDYKAKIKTILWKLKIIRNICLSLSQGVT